MAMCAGYLAMTQRVPGPFLVVVPLSTVPNWIREFRKWLPQVNALVYVGDSKSREASDRPSALCGCLWQWTREASTRARTSNTSWSDPAIVVHDRSLTFFCPPRPFFCLDPELASCIKRSCNRCGNASLAP